MKGKHELVEIKKTLAFVYEQQKFPSNNFEHGGLLLTVLSINPFVSFLLYLGYQQYFYKKKIITY